MPFGNFLCLSATIVRNGKAKVNRTDFLKEASDPIFGRGENNLQNKNTGFFLMLSWGQEVRV